MTLPLFVEWNGLLLENFFPPAADGEETWLQATHAELDSIGLRLGGEEGLVAAVKEGTPWLTDFRNVAEAAARLARQRQASMRPENYIDPGETDATYRSRSAPTYLPYLALWVLAASNAADGFYAQVERLSGGPFPSNSSQIRSDMLNVWMDLEKWTRECNGNFGQFHVRVLGEHQYVGIPRSQCLVSRKDSRGLPQLFSACGLRPRQALNAHSYAQIAEISSDAHYLSNGLRSAFTTPEYSDPLKRVLEGALEVWDGKAPMARAGVGPNVGVGQPPGGQVDQREEVCVVLRPALSPDDDWDIHWRMPALVNASTFDVEVEGYCWSAAIEEAGTHASTSTGQNQSESRRILSSAKESEIEFRVSFVESGDENGRGGRTLALAKRTRRILAWDVSDPNVGEELVEGEIPLAGPAYILFDESQSNRLERLFPFTPTKWEECPARGLPSGWRLGCILNSDRLSLSQRQELSGGASLFPERARIRLVGGRPIIRGGGKHYAFYDLPIVELEAPFGASVLAEGLEVDEMSLNLAPGCQRRSTTGVRRFGLKVEDAQRARFQIRVVLGGSTLATTTLKLTVAGGLGFSHGRRFQLDPLGRPSPSSIGLLGILHGQDGLAISGALQFLSRLVAVPSRKWISSKADRKGFNAVYSCFQRSSSNEVDH